MAAFEDYYEILQVSPSAEPEVIEAAYKKLAQKYHPDTNKSPSAAGRMTKINVAHDVLSDPVQRKKYHSEWLQRKGSGAKSGGAYALNPPKPIVKPSHIRFTNMEPRRKKRTSFTIDNAGGPYNKIWFSNPDSWVKVVAWHSTSSNKELPLEVEIEAEGLSWGETRTETIIVKLDDEEIRVAVELQMKPNPKAAPKAQQKTKSKPTPKPKPKVPAMMTKLLALARSNARILLSVGAVLLVGVIAALAISWFSYDGKIAFCWTDDSGLECHLHVVNTDGTGKTCLAYGDAGMCYAKDEAVADYPTWSPDGKWIAFISVSDGEIYIADSGGKNLEKLTNVESCTASPAWSPDGKKIAFVLNQPHDQEIYVIGADGKNQTRLTYNSMYPTFHTYRKKPVWSPDGKRIAYSTSYHNILSNDSETSNGYEIHVVNADGSNEKRLTNNSYADWWPVWAPNGKKIAFFSYINGEVYIYLMNADGSNPFPLTKIPTNIGPLSWSPDGSRIAFDVSSLNGRSCSISVINVDGSNLTSLTDNSNDLRWDIGPVWSPDGKKIVFTRNSEDTSDIYVMDADGSKQTRITDGSGHAYHPVWSPARKDQLIRRIFSSRQTFSTPEGTEAAEHAPDFSLPTLDGNTITLHNYRGKIVLLNFWSMLPASRSELPLLQQVYNNWSKDKYAILTINIKETDKDVQLFISSKGLTLPVLLDRQGEVAALYNIVAKPTSFLIDKQGNIREIKHGPFRTIEEVEESLNKLN